VDRGVEEIRSDDGDREIEVIVNAGGKRDQEKGGLEIRSSCHCWLDKRERNVKNKRRGDSWERDVTDVEIDWTIEIWGSQTSWRKEKKSWTYDARSWRS
jgi:hypothetical protein